MGLIDKKGKINKVTFKQIIKEAMTAHLGIIVGKTEVNTTPDQLLLDLFCLDVPNDKNVEVKIDNAIGDKTYVFTGKDFNWFLKADRLKDLSEYVYGYDVFSLTDEQVEKAKEAKMSQIKSIKPVKLIDMSEHHVAVATTSDPENPEIFEFKGYKMDCVKWLNQQIVKNATIENEVNLLICLDFSVDEPEWKTLKELFDEGKIDIC